ncbi:hypothetical protein LPLAFNJD_LOCUS1945 [Methylorubrum aminovorans]
MATRFRSRCGHEAVEVTLVRTGLFGGGRTLPRTDWEGLGGSNGAVARHLIPLVATGSALWEGDALLVANDAAAEFSGMLASLVGLPEMAPLLVDISFHGTIGDRESRIETAWMEASHTAISPARTGLQIQWGERVRRLGGPLYRLMEAIDRFNAAAPGDIEAKVTRWGDVTTALSTVKGEEVGTDAYTRSLTVFQAGSFALDIRHTPGDIEFTPILMSRTVARSLEDNAPVSEDGSDEFDELVDAETATLLVSEDRKAFIRAFDMAADGVRRSYALRRNTYLLIDPDLQKALDVVRSMRAAPEERKRAFLKNPRTVIATELGLDTEDPSLSAIFIETKQYSDRVIGLGVWQRPELTWLSKAGTEWLPERFPVEIDGKADEITLEEAGKLGRDTRAAEEAGEDDVPFREERITLPTARGILEGVGVAIRDSMPVDIETGQVVEDPREAPAETRQAPSEPVVVLIETNFEGVTYEVRRRPRKAVIPLEPPAGRMGATRFKPHQQEGFDWLVGSWVSGWPGVLLADDMGLGKSFQGLAFLAWLKANREAARDRGVTGVNQGPTLVVAPTALLQNWIQEAERHLAPKALGTNLAEVFGTGIKKFRNPDEAARALGETLDWRKIADHDWVLTTYETLADNHASFALINFSVVLFDEMQKVKDPGTLNTWAAKSVNADFVLGLTGTPIENRVEDLWCIVDRVFPGFLRDLRSFSQEHRDGDPERYRALSDRMRLSLEGAPAIMLRRMKEEVLEGLPEKRVRTYPTEMPSIQANAYGEVVARAVEGGPKARGAMLEIIQNLRGISLYPGHPGEDDLMSERGCWDWIERSARLGKTFEILRDLERRGEKGLVFVEQRGMQSLLSKAMSTVFGMEAPQIINGAVAGGRRQKMVDDFQARRRGFDAMILSPKAAGVGLTITAANHVIHLSRWWNPAVEDQCNDRVYRIGQERAVTVHLPIAVHPRLGDRTFDVTLHRLLERKRETSRNLLMPPVSEADLTEVFNMSVAA